MSISLYPPSRPRTLAELLDASFKIFRVSLLKCLPYATVAVLADQLATFYDLTRGHLPEPSDLHDPIWVTLYAVGGCLAVILWVATLLRQTAMAAGRPVNSSDLIDALKSAPAIVAIAMLTGAAVAVFLLVPAGLAKPYRTIGSLTAVVPAAYVFVALSFSLPARMLAHKGIFQSLTYSLELVRGNWWRVAAMYAVGASIIAVFGLLTSVVAGMMLPDTGDTAAIAQAVLTTAILAILAVGSTLCTAIWLSVFADLQARRSAKPA